MAFQGNQHAAGDPEPTARKERTAKQRKAAGGPGVDEKLSRDVKRGRDDFAVGSGKKCPGCGGTVAAGRKSCQNCSHSFGTLAERVVELEAAILALAAVEFGGSGSGENEGHPFRGNQHSSEGGGKDEEPKEKKGLFGKFKEGREKRKAENEAFEKLKTPEERAAFLEKGRKEREQKDVAKRAESQKHAEDSLAYVPGTKAYNDRVFGKK